MSEDKHFMGETIEITPQTFHNYDLLQIYIDRARLHGILDRLSRSSHWMCSSISFYIACCGFFIPLVTAGFKSLGGIDSNAIKLAVVVLTISCGIAGTLSLVRSFINRNRRNVNYIIDTEILHISVKSKDLRDLELK